MLWKIYVITENIEKEDSLGHRLRNTLETKNLFKQEDILSISLLKWVQYKHMFLYNGDLKAEILTHVY